MSFGEAVLQPVAARLRICRRCSWMTATHQIRWGGYKFLKSAVLQLERSRVSYSWWEGGMKETGLVVGVVGPDEREAWTAYG